MCPDDMAFTLPMNFYGDETKTNNHITILLILWRTELSRAPTIAIPRDYIIDGITNIQLQNYILWEWQVRLYGTFPLDGPGGLKLDGRRSKLNGNWAG